MLGNIFEVILAEPSFFNKKDAIGYILKGGPKVLVKNAGNRLEDSCSIKVMKVISDKLVEGIIVN